MRRRLLPPPQRLLLAILAVASLLYALLARGVSRDASLTEYGRYRDADLVAVRGETLDREARWGGRSVVWLVGSSIIREAFDEQELREHLRRRGLDRGVEKLGFSFGAPVFAKALSERLDIRPGDTVVTVVAQDHFRRDWITQQKQYESFYLAYFLEPGQVLVQDELPLARRVASSVWYLPPRSYWRHRSTWGEGARQWGEYLLGQRKNRPSRKKRGKKEPFREFLGAGKYLDDWAPRHRLSDADTLVTAEQVNGDALARWSEQVAAHGADFVVVYVPHNPHYYSRFVTEGSVERFHTSIEALVPNYVPLSALPADHYIDFKHPNFRGRAQLTTELGVALTP